MIQAAMPQQSYQNMQFPMQPDLSNAFMLDENNPNYLQMFPMQNLEQMMPMTDRRMSQPDLRIQTGLRPYTPTQQLQTGKCPKVGPIQKLTGDSTLPINTRAYTSSATSCTTHTISSDFSTLARAGEHDSITSSRLDAKVKISAGNCRAAGVR